MDEIICSQCGRPNLAEAKKCWFCQTEFESSQENPSDNSGETAPQAADEPATKLDDHPDNGESENIPDWLRRVREFKQADAPPEEESPDWEQTKLFNGETGPDAKKKNSRPKPAKSKQKSKEKPVQKDQGDQKAPAQPETEINTGDEDADTTTLSEDLPDGFIKI